MSPSACTIAAATITEAYTVLCNFYIPVVVKSVARSKIPSKTSHCVTFPRGPGRARELQRRAIVIRRFEPPRRRRLPVEIADVAATATVATRNLVSPSDELFFLLEGQTIQGRGSDWRIQVCGVYSTDTDRWIQLNLAGPLACGVTVRTSFMAVADLLDLLRYWLDDSLPSELESCIVSQARCELYPWISTDTGHSPTLTM
jgi:hypothetical protein